MTSQDFAFVCKLLLERSAIVLSGQEYLVIPGGGLWRKLELGSISDLVDRLRAPGKATDSSCRSSKRWCDETRLRTSILSKRSEDGATGPDFASGQRTRPSIWWPRARRDGAVQPGDADARATSPSCEPGRSGCSPPIFRARCSNGRAPVLQPDRVTRPPAPLLVNTSSSKARAGSSSKRSRPRRIFASSTWHRPGRSCRAWT